MSHVKPPSSIKELISIFFQMHYQHIVVETAFRLFILYLTTFMAELRVIIEGYEARR